MKLAQILATSPLPTGSPARLASPTVAPLAVGLKGLAEASASIAGTAARVGELQARANDADQRAEDAKRKHQEALDASRTVSATLDQLDVAETTLQMGSRDPVTDELVEAPVSSRDYMPAWLKLRDKLTQDALGQAATPEAKLIVGKLLETPLRERQHAARKFSNTLFMTQYTTGVEDELQSLARRAVTDPQATPEGADLWETRAMGVLAGAQGALGAAKVRQLREQFTTQVDTARARRLGETDPEAAIEALEGGQYRLPPTTADAEAERIRGRWDRRVKQADADQRRMETEMDRWWKEQQELTVSDAVLKAHRGAYTLEQLEEDARDWRLHREDIAAIRAAIERPEKPGKEQSDPATLDRVIADTHSQFPKMTEAKLLDLRTQGVLSVGDWKGALDRLRETREGLENKARAERERVEGRGRAESERVESRTRSIALNRHGQAEQELRAALGIPTLFDKLDEPQRKAWSAALTELRGRSNAYDGKEDPLKALEDMTPRYKRVLGVDAQFNEEQLRKLLLFPTPAALEAAKATLPQATYRQQQDLFRQLKDLVDTRVKMLEEQAAKPGGTKPGGTMGRK